MRRRTGWCVRKSPNDDSRPRPICQLLSQLAGKRFRGESKASELKRLGWKETPNGPIDPQTARGFESLRVAELQAIENCVNHQAQAALLQLSARGNLADQELTRNTCPRAGLPKEPWETEHLQSPDDDSPKALLVTLSKMDSASALPTMRARRGGKSAKGHLYSCCVRLC